MAFWPPVSTTNENPYVSKIEQKAAEGRPPEGWGIGAWERTAAGR